MRLMVFGAMNAQLGVRFCERAEDRGHDVVRATRKQVSFIDVDSLYTFIKEQTPECIVNLVAVGQTSSSMPEMVLYNSYFPHLLQSVTASLGHIPIVHASSDAVFSGRLSRPYRVTDVPDPKNYYGKTRSLGEVIASNVAVVRTSYVGIESPIVKSILKCTPGGMVDGWTMFRWSGSTTDAVVDGLLEQVMNFQPGIRHLATAQSVSKYDVVLAVIQKLGLNTMVRPVNFPVLNKSLEPTCLLTPLEEAIYVDRGFSNLCQKSAN